MRTKQLTVHHKDGSKSKIISYCKSYQGNPAGFDVKVNGKKYFVFCLSHQEAMDKAYAKYLKENINL